MRSTSARKLGSRRLRGWGSVTRISLRMRPGLLPNTRMRSHISTASSMLCVTRIDALDGHAAFGPQIQEVGAQGFGRQHIERRERLVHQQNIRDARPARAQSRRAGACRRRARADRRIRSRRDRSGRWPPASACGSRPCGMRCASRPSATFSNTVSQGNSAKLWNTMAMPAAGPAIGWPMKGERAGAGLGEAGDQSQQRRFARAGTAEQPHDLPRLQRRD